VQKIDNFAFNVCPITSMVIPSSVTEIGNHAFAETRITSICVPSTVLTVGSNAFGTATVTCVADSTGTPSAEPTAEYYVCSKAVLESGTYCDNRAKVTFAADVTAIPYGAFAYEGGGSMPSCPSLTHLIIPDGVTSIQDYAFDYNSNLKSVVIANTVTTIADYAFRDCTSLDTLVLSTSLTSISLNTLRV
jgi:BspA type Leucine rich repeat region (6 copies)